MKSLPTFAIALLVAAGALSEAQGASATPAPQPSVEATSVQPTSAPPSEAPPAAPQVIPSPPQEAPPQAAVTQLQPPSPAAGQWVYTTQYGWVWMAYGAGYTSAPAGANGVPYAYVYYPSAGWTWLAAPWVLGFGPSPYFGVYGPARFGWYRPGFYGVGLRPGFGYRPYAGYHVGAFAGRGFHAAGRGFGRR
jgi:hypothetical protein